MPLCVLIHLGGTPLTVLPGCPVPIIGTCPDGTAWTPLASAAIWEAITQWQTCMAAADARYRQRLHLLGAGVRPGRPMICFRSLLLRWPPWLEDLLAALAARAHDRAQCNAALLAVLADERRRICGDDPAGT